MEYFSDRSPPGTCDLRASYDSTCRYSPAHRTLRYPPAPTDTANGVPLSRSPCGSSRPLNDTMTASSVQCEGTADREQLPPARRVIPARHRVMHSRRPSNQARLRSSRRRGRPPDMKRFFAVDPFLFPMYFPVGRLDVPTYVAGTPRRVIGGARRLGVGGLGAGAGVGHVSRRCASAGRRRRNPKGAGQDPSNRSAYRPRGHGRGCSPRTKIPRTAARCRQAGRVHRTGC